MKILVTVILLLLHSTYSFSKEVTVTIDNQVEKGFCNRFNDVRDCFTYGIKSQVKKEKLNSVLVYLNNFDSISDIYDYKKLLVDLNGLAISGDINAIILEASIYYSGFHVDRNVEKSISLLEEIPEGKVNEVVYNLLGKSYFHLFELESEPYKKDELYTLTKEYLYKSHLMGMEASTRALAFVMVKYGSEGDFIEAGKLLEYLAMKGNQEDIASYDKYKLYAKEMTDLE
ncbi:hypothetical protein ACS86_05010 [Vibrio alginolyticus]|nr:hypothetical protein ACS86_05010 [Vibrio alginolyticus]